MTDTYIEQFLGTPLTPRTRDLINQHTAIVHFPAGRTVLREGDRSSNLYLILKGLVRGYYIDSHGNDITKCFSMEYGLFSSEGLRTDSPSTFTIECLEDCECVELPYRLLRELMGRDETFRLQINTFFLQEIAKLEFRSRDLLIKSAGERYRCFCETYPGLHERMALKHIASYIGVRAASLSRIRSQRDK